MSRPVFRFAPSPNGYLHLGHALSALLNAEQATQCGGRLLLRIEDIDRTRCKPEYEAAILEDLAWLGLTWEEPVRRQSEHFDAYGAAVAKLAACGLVYRSFASRADIARLVAGSAKPEAWPRDPDGAPLFLGQRLSADEEMRLLGQGLPFAWRIDMQKALAIAGPLSWTEESGDGARTIAADPAAWGDVILARKETPTSYHLSVVIDDALQGVTHVVRGDDLSASTSVHRLLQALLGLPEPRYYHHALVRDGQGRKLSKSTGATALRTLRAGGVTSAEIRRRLQLPV